MGTICGIRMNIRIHVEVRDVKALECAWIKAFLQSSFRFVPSKCAGLRAGDPNTNLVMEFRYKCANDRKSRCWLFEFLVVRSERYVEADGSDQLCRLKRRFEQPLEVL